MLYSFSFQIHPGDILRLIIPVFLGLLLYFTHGIKRKGIRAASRILLSFTLLFAVYSLLVLPIRSYYWAKQQLDAGKGVVVQGAVYNYDPSPSKAIWGYGSESFEVANVVFRYDGTENYGYSVFQKDGGIISEGLYLQITYLEDPFYGENRICCIEEIRMIR